jgi:regulator of RNase E activity RraA
MQHRALDRAAPADRPLVEAARHAGVGNDAALAHRGGEFGLAGDPVVDGALRDIEEVRQLGVGRAQQAVVAGQFTVLRPVEGGTAHGAHRDR